MRKPTWILELLRECIYLATQVDCCKFVVYFMYSYRLTFCFVFNYSSFDLIEGLFSPVDPTLVRLGSIAVSPQDHESFHERYVENDSGNPLSSFSRPHCVHVQPVFDDFYNNQSNIVGFLASVIAWDRYVGMLPFILCCCKSY